MLPRSQGRKLLSGKIRRALSIAESASELRPRAAEHLLCRPLIEAPGGGRDERSGWQRCCCTIHLQSLDQIFCFWLPAHKDHQRSRPDKPGRQLLLLQKLLSAPNYAFKAIEWKNDGVDVVAVRFLLPQCGIKRRLQQFILMLEGFLARTG